MQGFLSHYKSAMKTLQKNRSGENPLSQHLKLSLNIQILRTHTQNIWSAKGPEHFS